MQTTAYLEDQSIDKIITNINSCDLAIHRKNNKLIISPIYFNFNFLVFVLFIAISMWLSLNHNDAVTILLTFFIIAFSIISIISQADSYNKLIIDRKERQITIVPNKFSSIYKRETIIGFNEIHSCFSGVDSIQSANRRFIIKILLIDGTEIKMINAKKEENADILVKVLHKIVQAI